MRSDSYDYGSIFWTKLSDEDFAEAARRPDVWINAARPLRVGAYILRKQAWPRPRDHGRADEAPRTEGLHFTSLFLAALALENVLKSLLFVRHPERVKDKKLDFGVPGHDLAGLAKTASFELSPDEEGFLRVSAGPSITTFGRYATPLKNNSDCPGSYTLHTGSFGHFEEVFRRSAQAALREWSAGAADDRVRIAEDLLRGIETDVPSSIRSL